MYTILKRHSENVVKLIIEWALDYLQCRRIVLFEGSLVCEIHINDGNSHWTHLSMMHSAPRGSGQLIIGLSMLGLTEL